ncbi:MAG: type VI secretion system contractile sheath large subunit [Rhodospirillales bacterium]|nr:type VI secretion system contractile sheath large subunit [Rhodospirillales bacterium]
MVLDGRFVGAGRDAAAAHVAAFVAASDPATWLRQWFGPERATLLAGDGTRLRLALDRDIAAIDTLIASQLDAILHHPRLSRLEGAWRGLAWLIGGIEPGGRVKVRVLNAAWQELVRDLERAAEFDQSQLFRKIYEEEFGTPGGEPYGLMVIDHAVRHRPAAGAPTDDIGALKQLAGVAAASFTPTVLGVAPELLGLDRFADLAGLGDPTEVLRGGDYARWRGLFTLEDIRFLALALPRMLARPPWRPTPLRAEPFRYEEEAPDAQSRVWMNPAYAFAATVARAFADFSWPADVRGVETDERSGGLVDELPLEPFSTEPGPIWVRPPLEVVLTDNQERALVDAGFMPLASIPWSEDAVFGAVRSLQAPRLYAGATAEAANANARLSAQINTLLCVSRFAHYLKVLGRDMVGSFRTAEEIERQLQAWLNRHVNASVAAGAESRARYPLLGGRVTVRERPGRPGVFGCIIQLQPHFQLDDVSASFRLVTDIAAPGSVR